MPKGLEEISKEYPRVVKLNKALYGLRRSPKLWKTELEAVLIELGMSVSTGDACLYSRGKKDTFISMIVYVDDMLIESPNVLLTEELVSQLKSKFALKDLGEPATILGIQVSYGKEYITLDQNPYIVQSARELGIAVPTRRTHMPLTIERSCR